MTLASVHWSVYWDHRHELLEAVRWTIQVSVVGILGATVIGVLLGAIRAARVPVLNQLAAVYVEVIRNTPILVQIFLLFYGFAEVSPHLRFSPYRTACIAVIIWGGAFNTENFRAGFEAVPRRYREAGLALGFTPVATFFRVTLPIGGRIALPSTINTYVSVLKNTSLMTAIGFVEVTSVTRSIASETFLDRELLAFAGATYLLLVWTLSALLRFLERRLAVPEEAR